MGMKMVALFSSILVRDVFMGNSYENVGRFTKSPYKFSFHLVSTRSGGIPLKRRLRDYETVVFIHFSGSREGDFLLRGGSG